MWLPFLVPSSQDEWRDWLIDDAPKLVGIVLAVLAVRAVSAPLGRRLLGSAVRSAGRLRGEEAAVIERRAGVLQGTITWAVTLIASIIGIVINN